MEILNIAFSLSNPIEFFSKYHEADLFLNIKGNFSVQVNSPEKFSQKYNKQMKKLIIIDFSSALQASLSLIANEGNIFLMLADIAVFEKINTYIKICLENWNSEYGIEFLKFSPSKASFDRESIEIIKISEQIREKEPVINNNRNLWECSECGCMNDSKFCKDCGTPKKETWKCVCGTENDSIFCKNCGTPKEKIWNCICGSVNKGNFCPKCGKAR